MIKNRPACFGGVGSCPWRNSQPHESTPCLAYRGSFKHVCACCCRLNWQLHFGEPPKWAHGVRFILVDPEPSERDAGVAAQTLRGVTWHRKASLFRFVRLDQHPEGDAHVMYVRSSTTNMPA